MSDERWVVEYASTYLADVWHPCSPKYISQHVAFLAVDHVWFQRYSDREIRVRRVA